MDSSSFPNFLSAWWSLFCRCLLGACLLGACLSEACIPTKPNLQCRPCPCPEETHSCEQGVCVEKNAATVSNCLPQEVSVENVGDVGAMDSASPKEVVQDSSSLEEVTPDLQTPEEATPEPVLEKTPTEPKPTGPCLPTRLVGELTGHSSYVNGIGFLPGKSIAITSSLDQNVRVWDLNTRQILQTEAIQGAPFNLTVSPDGLWLAFAVSNNVQLWKISQNKITYDKTLSSHTDEVTSMEFQSGSDKLATAGKDKKVLLWDIFSGKLLTSLENTTAPVKGPIVNLAFHPQSNLLLAVDEDVVVRVWDVDAKEVYQNYVASAGAVVGRFTSDGLAMVYAVAPGHQLDHWFYQGSFSVNFKGTGHTAKVTHLDVHPQKPWAVSGGQDTTVRFWDLPSAPGGSGGLRDTLTQHKGRITGLAFQPNGQGMLSASVNGQLLFWGCP
ncbi:MAG: hypothetical protein EP343_12140 [Deltaproteobacteria bacterium]|nr:MAG: hypothetical protein EP343_12140 [Deltaproteobacteria bacterium]